MRSQWIALVIDLALVTAFVLIGRASHAAGDPLIHTLWPFLVGLLAGWLAARAWRRPLTVRAGLIIWPVTVAGGIVLRALTGQGVQLSFIIVTTLVLGVFLLGWRLVARAVTRRPR